MKYQKSKEFIRYIMDKHNITRKKLTEIMEVSMTTVHYYLVGHSIPKKENLAKLAHYLKEEPKILEAFAYDVNQDIYTGGKPSYPNTREEILKHCHSRGASVEIVDTSGVHDFELLLSGYTYMLLEDLKRLDTLKNLEVINKDYCLEAIKEFEDNESKRKEMFNITGKWFASREGFFIFENASFDTNPVKFFFDWKEAMKYSKQPRAVNEEEETFLRSYRKLPNFQKAQVKQIIKEKLFFITFAKDSSLEP